MTSPYVAHASHLVFYSASQKSSPDRNCIRAETCPGTKSCPLVWSWCTICVSEHVRWTLFRLMWNARRTNTSEKTGPLGYDSCPGTTSGSRSKQLPRICHTHAQRNLGDPTPDSKGPMGGRSHHSYSSVSVDETEAERSPLPDIRFLFVLEEFTTKKNRCIPVEA